MQIKGNRFKKGFEGNLFKLEGDLLKLWNRSEIYLEIYKKIKIYVISKVCERNPFEIKLIKGNLLKIKGIYIKAVSNQKRNLCEGRFEGNLFNLKGDLLKL